MSTVLGILDEVEEAGGPTSYGFKLVTSMEEPDHYTNGKVSIVRHQWNQYRVYKSPKPEIGTSVLRNNKVRHFRTMDAALKHAAKL
jgi:hypothetical protein